MKVDLHERMTPTLNLKHFTDTYDRHVNVIVQLQKTAEDIAVSLIREHYFYRAMHFVQSAVLRSHVVCLSVHLSVRPSVCNVGGSGPHGLEILETKCTNN